MWRPTWFGCMILSTTTSSSFSFNHPLCMTCSREDSTRFLNFHYKPQKLSDSVVSFSGLSQYVNAHLKLQEEDTFGILQVSSQNEGLYNMYVVCDQESDLYIKTCVFTSGTLELEDKHKELCRLDKWYRSCRPQSKLFLNGQVFNE